MTILNPVLNWSPFSRVRRNHALEHATLQVLSARDPRLRLAGYSDPAGFWVVGEVGTDELARAAQEALSRLRAGETGLAIHPFCGTNFVAAGLLGGSLAWLASLATRKTFGQKLERWPLMVLLATLGMVLARPLGPWLQAFVTTQPDPGSLRVESILRQQGRSVTLHRVRTRG